MMTYLIVPPDIMSGKSVFDRKIIIQAIRLPFLASGVKFRSSFFDLSVTLAIYARI